jgi:hypothetical protein
MSGNALIVRREDVALWVYERAHWALPAVGAVIVACAHSPLMGPVIDQGGDNADHLLNEYALANAAAAGDNPFGPLGLEFGVPLLRFYQALFYLVGLAAHLAFGLDVRTAHNLLVATCFTLSPFAFCFCLRRLGLPRFAAGLGSLAAVASVGAFGNSFEAYHGIGIATQSMGALFFPLFVGAFAGMLRGRNGWAPAALAFAAAFLAHAAMAVYAVLAGVLYVLVVPSDLRANWRRLALFGALGAALVAFWALPFVSHTAQMRAVPDAVFRGDEKMWWFTSVTEDEMIGLAGSGRLLDDEREQAIDKHGHLDALLSRISFVHSHRTRPPVMTALAALGLAVSLLRFRRSANRFLVSGLALSLMLFAGTDDFRWIGLLPLVEHVQSFRCTYLVEFFAYGLVGVGAEALLAGAWRVARSPRGRLRPILTGAWIAVAAAGIVAAGVQIALLGGRFVRAHDQRTVDEVLDAVGSIPNGGYPFRVLSTDRWNVFEDWLASGDYRPACTHWFGVGPSAGMQLCATMGFDPKKIDLYELGGIRYFSGKGKPIAELAKAKDRRGRAIYQRIANGKDRRGKDNGWHTLLDTGRDDLLVTRAAGAVVVVCDDAQWIWLVRSWLGRFGRRAGKAGTPMPMRVARGGLGASGLLEAARAVVYAGAPGETGDREALAAFAAAGGAVLTTRELDGVLAAPAGLGADLWRTLAAVDGKPGARRAAKAKVAVTRRDDPRRSNQRFAFDVSSPEPFLAVLPAEAAPGWTATLDGRALAVFPTGPDLVGAQVPAGAHALRFEWRMPGWHRGALAASILALAVALAVSLRRRRR